MGWCEYYDNDETDVETWDPSILAQLPSRSPGPRAAKRQMQDDNDGATATLEDETTNSLAPDWGKPKYMVKLRWNTKHVNHVRIN